MKVRYTIDALLHIASIHAYVNERNPLAATRVVARIRAAADRLGDFSRIGRAASVPGTREWVVTGLPYVIVHELNERTDEVVVIGVYHAAQLRPGQPAPER